jgi:hypothetical protein
MVSALALCCGAAESAAAYDGPLTAPQDWSGSVLVDPGRVITGMSCPSTSGIRLWDMTAIRLGRSASRLPWLEWLHQSRHGKWRRIDDE